MGRHHGFHLHELLGLQGFDLVAGLGDLEIADGGLAVRDQPVEAVTVSPRCGDDLRRDGQAVPVSCARLPPAGAGLFDEHGLTRRLGAIVFRVHLFILAPISSTR